MLLYRCTAVLQGTTPFGLAVLLQAVALVELMARAQHTNNSNHDSGMSPAAAATSAERSGGNVSNKDHDAVADAGLAALAAGRSPATIIGCQKQQALAVSGAVGDVFGVEAAGGSRGGSGGGGAMALRSVKVDVNSARLEVRPPAGQPSMVCMHPYRAQDGTAAHTLFHLQAHKSTDSAIYKVPSNYFAVENGLMVIKICLND